MKEPLKVSVFGAGVFAGYHADKVARHSRAELVSIYDPNADKADALANRHGASAVTRAEDAIAGCDAVICAVPATYHKTVCVPALASGRHVLLEKPMSATVDGAKAILAAAEHSGAVLQIGFQERIVAEAVGLHRIPVRPNSVEVIRHMGRTTRNLDTSIVMDMMIHDLDLLLSLYGPHDWAHAEATRSVYSEHADAVRAEVGWHDFTAYLSASRDSEPERRWLLRFDEGTVDVDFHNKTLRHDTDFDLDPGFGEAAVVRDNLAEAFDRFVSACLDGGVPMVSGQDGLEAVALAEAIEES